MRRHEHEADEAVRTLIHNPMKLTRFGKKRLAGFQGQLLGSAAKRALAFENDHHLVFAIVGVRGLRLPGLQAIEIAEEARGLEKVVLPHLRGIEFAKIFELDDSHRRSVADPPLLVRDVIRILYLMSMEAHPFEPNARWVRIVLHARAAELSGEAEVHVKTTPAATVRDLKAALGFQVPALSGIVASSAIATDADYLNDSALLGEETSFHLIPPVSGG